MEDVFEKKLNIVDIVQDAQLQCLFWKRRRLNPLVYIESDTLFKLTSPFPKPNVKKNRWGTSSRGDPFFAEQNVCSGLQILGGVHFFSEGACSGTGIPSAYKNLYMCHICVNIIQSHTNKSKTVWFFYFTKFTRPLKIVFSKFFIHIENTY